MKGSGFGDAQLGSAKGKAGIFSQAVSSLGSVFGMDTAENRDATLQKGYEGLDRFGSNLMGVTPSTSSFHPTERDSGLDSHSSTPPTRAEYRAAVNQSYTPGPPNHTYIGPFMYFERTPTLKFYIDQHTPIRYLVSVRGTKFGNEYGTSDLQADKMIAYGQLENSPRYQQDVEDMRRVLGDRPQGSKVYCTGHSLGGAICDLFLKQGLADGAVTYNPAMQLNAQEPRNHRVYNEHDPLYLLGIPHFNTPPEVKRDDVTASGSSYWQRTNVPYLLNDELRAHSLESLSGSGKMSGTGFFDSTFKSGTDAVQNVIDYKTGNKTFTEATGIDTNFANITDYYADVFGYNSFDERVKEFLRQRGSEPLTSLFVRRAPVAESINMLIDAITLGTWNPTRKAYGYDDIFHVSLIVNNIYVIQRIGRVSITMKDEDRPRAEYMNIPLGNLEGVITVGDLLVKTLERIGKDKFFKYDSFYNNCQHFLLFILGTFGLESQQVKDFVLQPTEELLAQQPGWTQTIANTFTNIGTVTGVGSGKPNSKGGGPMRGRGVDVFTYGAPTAALANKPPRGARGRNTIKAFEAMGQYMGLGPQNTQNAIYTPPPPSIHDQAYYDAVNQNYAPATKDFGSMFGKGKKTAEMYKAFSEDDIRSFTGNIPIMRYPELAEMTDPNQLFKGRGAAALLFLIEGPSEGHWIAVLDRPDHYEVFDSFGTAIDGHRQWLDKKQLMNFDQTAPLLSNLLKGKGKPVIHNTKKLQSETADTCGRYVAARIVQAATPLKQFIAELTSNGQTPDENIIEMTEPRDRAYPELANPA